MKVSVIVPTFNRASLLPRAIDSVLSQSYQDFDLTIVDDGSTDETYNLVKSYLSNPKIKYIRTDNRGVSAARNLGVALTNGEYISFLDSDDEWLRHKLDSQIKFLSQNENIQMVHADECWVRNGKEINKKNIHKKFGGDVFEKCLDLCFISPSVALMRRSLFNEMLGFDESYIVCEDFDLWLKISSLYEVGYIDEEVIIKYGGHEDQLSTMYFAMDYYRIKALDHITKIRSFEKERLSLVKDTIIKKSEILIKGYEKHKNFKNLAEIQNILESHRD